MEYWLLAAAGEAITHSLHHGGTELAHHHSEFEENPAKVLLEIAAFVAALSLAGWLWIRRD